ncbi:MAG: beta-ketoacyl-[acyl-carrier-protein] synthase II, partial [Planctomycetes bacterium]|nr:beta-ketoacyl-[acyl-carrier-protein] synthase II [Planctomycetota bacterium]
MTERVVITGMGTVCPLGHDVESLWQALLTGKSGVAKTTIFDASTFPTTFDAEVKDYDFAQYTNNPKLHQHVNRGSGFVIGATAQACKQAGIDVETI